MAVARLVEPLRRWAPAGGRLVLGAGYVVAAAVTILCVVLTSRSPGAGQTGPASRMILMLLAANLALIAALAAAVGWRVVKLFGERATDAGARLHVRFVVMFAMAAVLPAIVVALFFGVLVTRGVENWFSTQVRTVVENSATVARSYINEQTSNLQGEVQAMATDLNRAEPLFRTSPIVYGRVLEGQAINRYLPAAYVIDREGTILSSAESPTAPAFVTPSRAMFRDADGGDVAMATYEASDLIRALFKLSGYTDSYLYVVRRADKGILNHLRAADGSLAVYRDAEKNRRQIQAVFALTYVETVLLVLVGAVWLGLGAASAISAPVGRLVQAADKVASGDLSARVYEHGAPEEIAVLSRAFNRMTGDLQAQQTALRAASLDAESRRQFIETVLSGVTAGVVSVDKEGRVSAANRQAGVLLGFAGDAVGRKLADVASELQPVARKARGAGSVSEEEIDVVRGDEARRLQVRAADAGDGGLVLTFDDITRLMTAQRNAAWRDVARRIAHEIKNPLTPIQLSAERLRRKYRGQITGDVETFDRCTDTIIRQVEDIGRMVDEFSSFARMPAPRFGRHDAAELLREAVFAQRVANPDLEIVLDAPDGEVQLICDERMVAQALTNIIKNAGESIAARRHAGDHTPGKIMASLRVDPDRVTFEVQDNGVGLPPAERERLTEPYVTTREKGTGLGLAIVKRIMEEHGGELRLTDADALTGAKALLCFSKTLEEAAPERAATA